ncbi:hypothetical protein EYR40_004161 [Pleurotus pulmonarius]|nr:hypothetical protein EYR40_004161 [Pleurotus pulmonarius]KAF4606867.1 hypothetical protein EYR38_000922 [Pleurotus pulmonarius]
MIAHNTRSAAHSTFDNHPEPEDPSPSSLTMKESSTSSTRHARNNSVIYPKKRPSPNGVSKPRRSPLLPAYGPRKTPRSAKSGLIQQRQREAQIAALRREGILIEEEYREEIRYYMLDMEWTTLQQCTMCSLQSMDQQPEIRWHMRPCLVDFLVEVHFAFRLRPETLYLTLNIIDRYVSRRIVYVKHYQLVGCAALWIAAKFEDAKDRVPTVQELASVCQEAYDETAFIQMEGHVLSTIQWTLGHPTAEAWLRLMCCGPVMEEPKVQHVARFLMEITLFYREFVKHSPSTIALAALTLARYLCGKPRRVWEETDECIEVVEYLDNRLARHVNDLSEVLVRKYSYAFYSKAATFVVQYYLNGGHFMRQAYPSLPVTPVRSPASSIVSTPMSSTTSYSDLSDDMPVTPTSPLSTSDFFPSSHCSSDDKENMHSSLEPVIKPIRADPTPDEFLPHDYVSFGRPALHNLNVVSPRAMVA